MASVTDISITSEGNADALRAIAVVGPTACGKTHKAVQLASILNGEIISADSRQVYRDMDLGTGKDLDEYGDVKYHLIDICPAGSKYNLHKYLRDFNLAFADIRTRGKRPIICGGTGMYVEHALNGISLPDVPEIQNYVILFTINPLTSSPLFWPGTNSCITSRTLAPGPGLSER